MDNFDLRKYLAEGRLFEEKKVKSEISFGASYKKRPFINNSFVLKTLGEVNLLINKVNTAKININISKIFFLTVINQ